ncbi:PREDICTED: uncharacterized protein LOC108780827 [Cyphomyrmex costatus]|uniref:uncharacterized protein LOC108780827 n=1 Tax=Cyphomyrmex costatus TaxID=456900 RepID=UPI0008523F2C|nr:PREDICTED: uncharacterized protein LOC108780827 [Cyphomyrmex costatus]
MFGFCDAFEHAYGTCVYIQSVSPSGQETTIKLLCAKARVAPLKKQSIPRLKLCSALLLAKLIDNVKRAIHMEINEIRAWSDSMVVLYWLRGDIARWKPFVSNRVAEIVEILPAVYWNHVRGSKNPADLISRGATPIQLMDNSLWWNSPSWLRNYRSFTSLEDSNLEFAEDDVRNAGHVAKRLIATCHLIVSPSSRTDEIIHSLISNCSTLTKIEQTFAYCIRFISNCRKKQDERVLSKLTLAELESSRREIIKYSQRVHFAEDLKRLQNNRELTQTSPILQLRPFLDKDGMIRVGGRLQATSWNFERKHPILLPRQSRITRLLIERKHRALLYASQQLLLAIEGKEYAKSADPASGVLETILGD